MLVLISWGVKILSDRFRGQYQALLKGLSYHPELSAEDRLTVAGYFFLQDRIEEGLIWLDKVDELSLLVMSDVHGSLVREVSPPQR